jgi:hypothetical protein
MTMPKIRLGPLSKIPDQNVTTNFVSVYFCFLAQLRWGVELNKSVDSKVVKLLILVMWNMSPDKGSLENLGNSVRICASME